MRAYLFAFCFLVTNIVLSLVGYGQSSASELLAFTGARIYPSPSEQPIPDGVVLVEKGKIIEVGERAHIKIPAGAEIIDCQGWTLTAGFWNCHVHFMEPKWHGADTIPPARLESQLREMLTSYGFTYAVELATLDMSTLLMMRARIERGEVAGPRIFTVGTPLTPPRGSPIYILPLRLPEAGSAREAEAMVKEQIEAGADAFKVWTASPTDHGIAYMPEEILKTVVRVAHQYHKPVFAHPSNLVGAKIALRGGVDILAHTAPDDRETWSKELLEAMSEQNVGLIPTLKLFKWELEQQGIPASENRLFMTARQQLADFSASGGEVLFGTDVGYITDYSPADEYELMAQAGLTFSQILASLTTTPAKRMGLEDQTSTVAPGMNADLVLLSEDPEIDARNFSKVVSTYRNGRIIFQR